VRFEFRLQIAEDLLHVGQLGMARSVHLVDLGDELGQTRQLAAQIRMMRVDDIRDQLGEWGGRPIRVGGRGGVGVGRPGARRGAPAGNSPLRRRRERRWPPQQ
jgi:hypothetical protein